MVKKTLSLLAFVVLTLCLVEFSYRIYAAGSAAFNPAKFAGMTVLPRSGLVELSDVPEIYYELRPNLDNWFQNAKLKTNSFGLADREYSLEKPDNTFRVAVLGSSWTMATGVEQDETYHWLLEQQLNEANPDLNYEFLNFGVEMYGLREIVATLEHRALDWDPDLVVVSITSFTSYLKWQEPEPDAQLPSQVNPMLQSFAWRTIDRRFRIGAFERGTPGREELGAEGMHLYEAQIYRAIRELHALTEESGVPLVVMWMSFGKPGEFEDELQALCDELGVTYVPIYKAIAGTASIIEARQIGATNRHPNPRSHQRLADRLQEELTMHNLLPGTGDL